MRLQDFMITAVDQVAPTLSAEAAYQHMRAKRFQHLVVMEGRNVVGVVSDSDLGGPKGSSVRQGRTVADLMTAGVRSAPPDMPVRRAANLLRGNSIGCLPVIDRGRVVGIITASDLLELLGRGTQKPISESVKWTLRGRGPAGLAPRRERPVPRGRGLAPGVPR